MWYPAFGFGVGELCRLRGSADVPGTWGPLLAQLLTARWGRTRVFTPLVLGGLAVLGKLSGNGRKALHAVFKMLGKNSQQAFPLL